ncbi:MAG TPA: YajD family HNH nuclease [Kiritimatiellia bacterium]|nr:YajD family HNH nuclease [Kiritimatiellia bacterium]HMP96489.1 YajD family HNH nuclease [Kiritimatiellia bacterium]
MKKIRPPLDTAQRERIAAELRRDVAQRMRGYRERALAIYPHVCASCGREFSGVRLKELTVHHKDHNHDNNPPDGSNWELLCVYCHDHEHEKNKMAGHGGGAGLNLKTEKSALFNPFDQLDRIDPRKS